MKIPPDWSKKPGPFDGPQDDSGWLGDLAMTAVIVVALLGLFGGAGYFLLSVLQFAGKL